MNTATSGAPTSFFGSTASSAGKGGGLFGAGGAGTTGEGSTTNPDTTSASSPFGQIAPAGASLFGKIGSDRSTSSVLNPAQTSAQSTSGNTATSMPPESNSVLFGANTAKKDENVSFFGSAQLSGSTTPQGSKPGGMFGGGGTTGSFDASTTPAGEPKQTPNNFGGQDKASLTGNTFFGGSAKPGGGLFGAGATSSAPGSSFGGSGPFGGGNTATTSAPSTGGLFGNAASSTAGPTGGLFGSGANKPATSSTPNNMFGGTQQQSSASTPVSTGGSLFPDPQTSATTSAPASGGMFVAKTSATTSAPASGGMFVAKTSATTSAPASGGMFGATTGNPQSGTSQQSGLSLGGSSLLGKTGGDAQNSGSKPVDLALGGNSSSSSAQPASTTATAPSGLFGGSNTSSTPLGGSAATNAPSGPSVFAPASSAAGTWATTATSGNTATGGGGGADTTPGAATVTGPHPSSGSRLAQKSLDEVLTMWSTSLTQHQKTFQALAKKVQAWDRELVEDSTRISQLYGRCFQAERDCSEVERQLSNVEHTHYEIEHFLDKYEEQVDQMLSNSGIGEDGVGGVDAERERTYKMAETCHTRLNDFSASLTDMVAEINITSDKLQGPKSSGEAGDPLKQIVGVLNSHLLQLQKIGAGAAALQEQVGMAQREARQLSNSQSLHGSSNADMFGRSFVNGRR